MLLNILLFELRYRLKRPATWIYFAILFLFGFAVLTIDNISVGGDAGQVRGNSPFAINQIMVILAMIVGMLMNSGIMGVPVLRDFEHKTDSLMFTTPIRKFDYLFGRFSGSFLISILVFSGLMWGVLLGSVSPWAKDIDNLLPFNFYTFLHPFLFYVIPNLFITGSLFFAGGTLSRNIMYVYVFGIAVLVLWLIASNIVSDLENRSFAAMIEPAGLQAFYEVTRYWTPTQKNTQFVSWEGAMLLNRLFWLTIAVVSLVGTYFYFQFETVSLSFGDRIRKMFGMKFKALAPEAKEKTISQAIPSVHPAFDFSTQIRQIFALANVYYREIIRSVPFIAIVLMGLAVFFINAQYVGSMYDIEVFPTTYIMLELINGFNLFFIIIIIFYGGQMIWRERDLNMQQIYDALPISNAIGLISKFLGFIAVHATLLVVLMLAGMLNQVLHGYFDLEMGLYLKYLFTDTFSSLVLYTLLAFFIQVVSNNKFLGFALMVAFFVAMMVSSQWGLEHKLFIFGSGNLGTFSAMNQFGHFVAPFSWLTSYWLALTCVLFGLSVLLAVRGTDTLAKIRVNLMKQRFSRPIATFLIASLLFFFTTGSYIYYNTNVLNKYQNSEDDEKETADYEKTLKKYERFPQPKIIAENMKVDIFPDKRNFTATGVFTLQNKTDKPITDIHLTLRKEGAYHYDSLVFDRPFKLKEQFEKFGYHIYTLETPLQPQDSVQLRFKMRYETKGFPNAGSNLEVVNNGTFINNTYFPMLGYQDDAELSDNKKRKKYGLGEKNQSSPNQDDPYGLHNNLFGDDADFIRFEIQLSTSKDQIAIAPGYLQKEWEQDGRKYFHYKMDMPMCNFYNMSSARYEVKRDKYKDISLEIYYDKAHTANLDRMMSSMKKSLEMFERIYGPYQYRQLRILEFPRYRTFAQSFANTVPYSEGIGFILNEKEDDVDMCFYVTAHEIGHQWWGHQVMEAGVKGSAMLSETMAQYSALMVMKHNFPPEMMEKFLRYELDRYLQGRAMEDKRENPLYLTDNQQYIHYRKGSVVMYALQDYMGEDSVNSALKKFIQDKKWRSDIYPTAKELVGYFRKAAPDSLQNTITDLFEKITLYSLRANKPTYKKVGNEYEVTIPIHAEKKYFEYEKDAKGKDVGSEKPTPINDYIDIGVMGVDAKGKDKLLYLKREKINQADMTFTVKVKEKPIKAGIDPIHKLVDLDTKDNMEVVKE